MKFNLTALQGRHVPCSRRKGQVTLFTLYLYEGGKFMLRAAVVFFVLALVAMLLGASGVAGVSMEIGRTLLVVFLILAVISFVASLVSGKNTTPLP